MGETKAEPSLVVHSVEPIWSSDARVLILGTMPSPASREAGVPYAHPQNRFWPVVAALFDEEDPKTPAGRREPSSMTLLALYAKKEPSIRLHRRALKR